MREVRMIVDRWCDTCQQEHGDRTRATIERSIAIDGLARELDLCERHDKELGVGRLREALEAYGIRPDAQQAQARDRGEAARLQPASERIVPCEVCGANMRRGSLVQHIWAVHAGVPQSELANRARERGLGCPECGKRADSIQALSAHRVGSHGWSALDEALQAARSVLARQGTLT